MSRFEKFITFNGRVELGVPLLLIALAIAASFLGIPYVDLIMNSLAGFALVIGIVDLAMSKKQRVD